MKREQQVVSLELSKKLKELGYPQEGLFWWGIDANMTENGKPKSYVKNEHYEVMLGGSESWQYVENVVVAPTVAELGEWLPSFITFKGINCGIHSYIKQYEDISRFYYVSLREKQDNTNGEWVHADKTEANARAKMLIWLVENKYINFNQGV